MSVVYIAGPMTGYPQNNFPAFDAAESYLRGQCLGEFAEVISPANLSRAAGVSEDGNHVPSHLGYRDFLRNDLLAALRADTVYMLKGWEKSAGARVEHALATCLNLKIVYQN